MNQPAHFSLSTLVLAFCVLHGTLQGASQERANILVLIADDLGIDRVRAYGYRNQTGNLIAPKTPNIDQLAAQGVLFRNAWAAPACSPARASSLTGLYPNRTGMGAAIGSGGSGEMGLRDDISTVADLLPKGYKNALLGKWHIAGSDARTGGNDHAPRCGFDEHSGTFGNLEQEKESGSNRGYFSWEWLKSLALDLAATEVTRVEDEYVTSHTTNAALRHIEDFGDAPWFLWVAYHAPHKPYHVPPKDLIQSTDLDLSSELGQGKAMVEALDTEIGRLLAGIKPEVRARTTILFFGDNGTQRALVEAPFPLKRAKGTIYNGGIHVPLIISGPQTPTAKRGSECNALVDITDLRPTIEEICASTSEIPADGTSLLPYLADPALASRRKWIYAERFKPNFIPESGKTIASIPLTLHHQAVRGARYKLVRRWDSRGESLEFYDLQTDYFETKSLLDAKGEPSAERRKTFNALLKVLREMAE
ncbi:MAG: arylsulfatase A-like enzyme [Planctomycetota bacterium]|jgi:arylsulfatase A-like enzyme